MQRLRAALVGALVALVAGVAAADQLQWLESAPAQGAASALRPGTLFVSWVSHEPRPPTLYRVVSVSVEPAGLLNGWDADPVLREVVLVARRVAAGRAVPRRSWSFDPTPRAQPEAFAADLAYTYVPSAELPGMFVNLGKLLRLECDVRQIAIEVPGRFVGADDAASVPTGR